MFDLRFANLGFQLERLDLTDPSFAHAKIEFSAMRQDANKDGRLDGDGEVNVGYIDATGNDLGRLILRGDLGRIDVGDGDPLDPALKRLDVRSIAEHALFTQDPNEINLRSEIMGDVTNFTIREGISHSVSIAIAGRIGTGFIGEDIDTATITVLGALLPQTADDAVAIGKLTVGGRVAVSRILVGYDLSGAPVNGDVSIGKVKVIGNWIMSDLAVGIIDSTNDGFGRNDTGIGGGSASIIAQIAKITIKGDRVLGSFSPNESYGITAERIGAAKIGGTALTLTDGKDDILLDEANGNFRLVEV
jgi:hypothetical protein